MTFNHLFRPLVFDPVDQGFYPFGKNVEILPERSFRAGGMESGYIVADIVGIRVRTGAERAALDLRKSGDMSGYGIRLNPGLCRKNGYRTDQ